jgi:hypothetical protein
MSTRSEFPVSVATEKMIVRNALLRLFNPTMTSALLEGFYAQNPNVPQFLDSDATTTQQEPTPAPARPVVIEETQVELPSKVIQAKPTYRFLVTDFPDTHFAKDFFPKFQVNVVSAADSFGFLPQELMEFDVAIAINNKWVNVSNEVLAPSTTLIRTVKGGVLEIADLVFIDVSLKHGGFFTLEITPLNMDGTVSPWTSPRFAIQSVKTHCNKKRKTRETASVPMMQNSAPNKPNAFILNDVKTYLAPSSMPLGMDSMEYGLSGGFFDMDSDDVAEMFVQ